MNISTPQSLLAQDSVRYFCDTCDRFTATSSTCEHCNATVWINTSDRAVMDMVRDTDAQRHRKRSRQCVFIGAVVCFPFFFALGGGLFVLFGELIQMLHFEKNIHKIDLTSAQIILPLIVLGVYAWTVFFKVERPLMKALAPISTMDKIYGKTASVQLSAMDIMDGKTAVQTPPNRTTSIVRAIARKLTNWDIHSN